MSKKIDKIAAKNDKITKLSTRISLIITAVLVAVMFLLIGTAVIKTNSTFNATVTQEFEGIAQ